MTTPCYPPKLTPRQRAVFAPRRSDTEQRTQWDEAYGDFPLDPQEVLRELVPADVLERRTA